MQRLIPQDNVLALVHSDEYANWVFDPQHPTQGRRFVHAARRLRELAPTGGVDVVEIEANFFPDFAQVQDAHTFPYIEQVLLDGVSGEWAGQRRDLASLALRMAGGTIQAAEALLTGRALTAVNFAGAKHHAMRDRSSGFCVFNDFVLAARHVLGSDRKIFCPITASMKRVRRIAILDIDAHHGDGTEALLRDSQRVFTFSVHDRSIFPGTGAYDDPDSHVFNRPLEAGSGDEALIDAVADFVLFVDRFRPDMIFIAIGADGLEGDPLSTLTYTIDGLEQAVRNVRRAFPEMPMLLGGAGGYQPDDATPEAWARMAVAASTPVSAGDEYWVSTFGDIGYLDDPEERGWEPVDEYSSRDARALVHEHMARHAHLFADPVNPPLQRVVEWVAPADPSTEQCWAPACIGQIRPGEKVRVLRDAFADEELGRLHNGRICRVLDVVDGDVICDSIDEREPALAGAHYAPYHLEQWVGWTDA